MDKLIIKKIIEINLEKGKAKNFSNREGTLNAYCKLIDYLDEHYKISIGRKLSPLSTPVIIIGYRLSIDYPLIYCFDGRYYFNALTSKTIITNDVSEVLKLIDEHFYGMDQFLKSVTN